MLVVKNGQTFQSANFQAPRNFCHQTFLLFLALGHLTPPFIFFKNKFFKTILFFLCIKGMNICLWNTYHFATHTLQNSAFFEKGHHGGVKKRYFFCKKQGFYFKNIEKNIFVNILCCTLLERCKICSLAPQTE